MPEVKIQLGPPKGGMIGKIGEKSDTEGTDGESSTEDDAVRALYQAIVDKDEESFVEAFVTAIHSCMGE